MRVGVSLAAELQLHKLTDYEARGQSIWKTVSVNLLRTRSSARFLGHIFWGILTSLTNIYNFSSKKIMKHFTFDVITELASKYLFQRTYSLMRLISPKSRVNSCAQ